jgi:hypothetical protein
VIENDPLAVPAPPPTSTIVDLVRAAAGGLLGAIVGGLLWGLLVEATDTEIGFAATGVGALAGFGTVLLSRARDRGPLQVISAGSAIAGILLGKYAAFVFMAHALLEERVGPDAGAVLPFFSGRTVSLFVQGFGEVFGGFDLLWVGSAVYTAWRIPAGQGFGRFASSLRQPPAP